MSTCLVYDATCCYTTCVMARTDVMVLGDYPPAGSMLSGADVMVCAPEGGGGEPLKPGFILDI